MPRIAKSVQQASSPPVIPAFADAVQSEKAPAEAPQEAKPQRKRKNVFNGTQLKLGINKEIPGYHLHIMVDANNRIKEAIDNGYEFVTPKEVGGVGENVVSHNGDLGDKVRFLLNPRTGEGSDKYGYLMKIRQEWYLEDQAALQTKNNQIDIAIRKGKVTATDSNFYVPRGGISMKS